MRRLYSALDQHPARGPSTGNFGAFRPRPPSTLSCRDRCPSWSCAAVLVSLGAVAAEISMRIYEERVLFEVSGIQRLRNADGPFAAGRVLGADLGK